MNDIAKYPYQDIDLIESPVRYSYTPYVGRPFLERWRTYRDMVLASLTRKEGETPSDDRAVGDETASDPGAVFDGRTLLFQLASRIRENRVADSDHVMVEALMRGFELRKRFYSAYDSNLRPINGASYRDPKLYLLGADIFLTRAESLDDLRHLNTALKVIDSLCSVHETLRGRHREWLADLISRERALVETLLNETDAVPVQ